MAKELPYFQFEPAEYLTKDISFCSLSAQGLFINICAFYWQRKCELTKEQFLRRFDYENEFNELVSEGVIDVIDGIIRIKFLDEQLKKATEKSSTNSVNGGKGGRPKKQKETEIKPNENPIESETKGIRKEEIRKEETKQENFSLINKTFFNSCLESEIWITETAMNSKSKFTPDEVIQLLHKFQKDTELNNDKKSNDTEYRMHFRRWLDKQPKETINFIDLSETKLIDYLATQLAKQGLFGKFVDEVPDYMMMEYDKKCKNVASFIKKNIDLVKNRTLPEIVAMEKSKKQGSL